MNIKQYRFSLGVLIVLIWVGSASSARFTQCIDPVTGEVYQCLELSPEQPKQQPKKKEGPPVRSCRGYEDKLLKLKEDLAFTSEMFPDAKRNRIKLKIEEEFVGFKKFCPEEYESFCQYEKSLCQEE